MHKLTDLRDTSLPRGIGECNPTFLTARGVNVLPRIQRTAWWSDSGANGVPDSLGSDQISYDSILELREPLPFLTSFLVDLLYKLTLYGQLFRVWINNFFND